MKLFLTILLLIFFYANFSNSENNWIEKKQNNWIEKKQNNWIENEAYK